MKHICLCRHGRQAKARRNKGVVEDLLEWVEDEEEDERVNGERVFQPVFVHGLENPCSVRYDHCLAKPEVIIMKQTAR